MAIVSMEEDNFDFVDKIVDSGMDDVYSFNHNEIELPKTFIDKYSNHLKKKFNVSTSSVVVNKTDDRVIQELKDMGEQVVTVDRKIYADIINKTLQYSQEKYNKASTIVSSRSRIDDAWSYYRSSAYKTMLDWYRKYKAQLSSEADEEFKTILEDNEPYLFELIEKDILSDL